VRRSHAIPPSPEGDGPLATFLWVQTELRVVGMPAADLDPALPADERVRRSLPSPRRIRNTAMAWCLHRIFRDHCDFDEPHLTESNDRDLSGPGTGA